MVNNHRTTLCFSRSYQDTRRHILHFIRLQYKLKLPSANCQTFRPLTQEEEGRWSRAPRYDQLARWLAYHERTATVRSTYSATRTQASSWRTGAGGSRGEGSGTFQEFVYTSTNTVSLRTLFTTWKAYGFKQQALSNNCVGVVQLNSIAFLWQRNSTCIISKYNVCRH